MSQTDHRRQSTSTDIGAETDTASFLTPLDTPTRLSRIPSRPDLDDESTPRKLTEANWQRSGTVTPTKASRQVETAGIIAAPNHLGPEVIYNADRPLPRDIGTSTTSFMPVESRMDAEKQALASISLANQGQETDSKDVTLGGDSARVSEKDVSKEFSSTKDEPVAAPGDPTGLTTGVATGVAEVENEEEEAEYPGGLALGLITAGLLLATFVVALDNTIIGKGPPAYLT